jgi:hypothetical protein
VTGMGLISPAVEKLEREARWVNNKSCRFI